MLVGQENTLLTLGGGTVKIPTIHSTLSNIVIDNENTTIILAIKHHKRFKILVKLIFDDDSFVIVGKHTYLQVVEEHDIGKIIEAKDAHPGQILCPPLPSYVDIRIWGSEYGKNIKHKQTVFGKASTILFDKCEYVTINDAPILHDNHQFSGIRKLAKRTNSVANLLFKHTQLYKIE